MKSVILLLLFSFEAMAGLKVNVDIIRKKGIDKGLVLVSELHSSEVMYSGEQAILKMQNGLILTLDVDFIKDPDTFGPSSLLGFRGTLFPSESSKIGIPLVSEGVVKMSVGETRKITLSGFNNDEGQLVEVSLSPKFE